MKSKVKSNGKESLVITPALHQMLISLKDFRYLTIPLYLKLHHASGMRTTVNSRFVALEEEGFVERLKIGSQYQGGSPASCFTLGAAGRAFLKAHGYDLPRYKVTEERRKRRWFLDHAISVNWVLASLARLCRDNPRFVLTHILHERELRQNPMKVTIGTGKDPSAQRTVALIPDAWTRIANAGEDIDIAWECDRNTEPREKIALKVRAYVGAIKTRVYQERLASGSLTVAFVVMPAPDDRRGAAAKRVQDICRWIADELTALGEASKADLFLVADGSDIAGIDPGSFLTGAHWLSPASITRVPLLEDLTPEQRREPEVTLYEAASRR